MARLRLVGRPFLCHLSSPSGDKHCRVQILSTRERPKLLFDADGVTPVVLFNGVSGQSVDDTAGLPTLRPFLITLLPNSQSTTVGLQG